MYRNDNEYNFNRNFVKKYVPAIFTINCFFIWIMIIIGTMQIFGSGLLGFLVCAIPLVLNVYIHISTYIYLCEKYDIDQN